MPKIIGPYTTVKVGHKVKVENDAKPTFKLAKPAPWYYAVQVKEEGNVQCLLMTEAQLDKKKIVMTFDKPTDDLGILVVDGIYIRVVLFDETTNEYHRYRLYKSDIRIAKERASKYPHLCTKIGLFARIFG